MMSGHDNFVAQPQEAQRGSAAGRRWSSRLWTSVPLLVVLTLGLILATAFLSRGYHALQNRLARSWYEKGELALKSNQPDAAVEDFRNALAYAREDSRYRLRLAQALLAANHLDEATAHFLSLWQNEPGNGEINLALARLAVLRQDAPEALRYFHAAIYGAWDTDPESHRREARLELINFLLAQNRKSEAHAEVTALAANLPPGNPSLRLQAAELFVRTGDYANALDEYRRVLAVERRNQAALAGAGNAALQSGQFLEAWRYLEAAVRERPQDARSAELLQLAELVLRMDPFARGISEVERDRRGMIAFKQAGERLQQCAQAQGAPPLATAEASPQLAALQALNSRWLDLRPQMTLRNLLRHPDLLTTAMDLVFEIEQQTERECGAPTGADMALLLIARNSEGSPR